MEIEDIIKRISLVSVSIFILTVLNTYLFLYEDDYSRLNNGILIFVSFYLQIALILYNVIIAGNKAIVGRAKLKKLLYFESVGKFIVFITYNSIFINLRDSIPMNIKFSVLVMILIIDLYFLYKMYINCEQYKEDKEIVERINKREINFSLAGFLIYSFSVWFFNDAILMICFKIILFWLSIHLIFDNLKKYHEVTDIRNKMTISLIIGAVLNIILVGFINICPDVLTLDILVIKDIVVAISLVFLIPYMNMVSAD